MKQGDVQGLVMVIGMLTVLFGLVFLVPRGVAPQDIIPQEIASAAVAVSEPTAEGLPVTYTLETDGFVSVHRAMGDAPGEIVGQVAVPAGAEQRVVVPTPGMVGPVIVLLFVDDGDGVFNAGADRPVIRDGASVRAKAVLSGAEL